MVKSYRSIRRPPEAPLAFWSKRAGAAQDGRVGQVLGWPGQTVLVKSLVKSCRSAWSKRFTLQVPPKTDEWAKIAGEAARTIPGVPHARTHARARARARTHAHGHTHTRTTQGASHAHAHTIQVRRSHARPPTCTHAN